MKHDGEKYKRANLAFVFVIFALLIFIPGAIRAQETSGGFLDGSIKIGYDSRTCDSTLAGSLRYNSGAGGGGGGIGAPQNVQTASGQNISSLQITNYAIGAGSGVTLVVVAHSQKQVTSRTLTATFGATPMTEEVTREENETGDLERTSIFSLPGASGTATITLTPSASTNSLAMEAFYITGTDENGAEVTADARDDTSPSLVSIGPGITEGAAVIYGLSTDGASTLTESGITELADHQFQAAYPMRAGAGWEEAGATGSEQGGWSAGGGLVGGILAAASFAPSGGGSPPCVEFCNGSAWTCPASSGLSGPAGCANIGDLCADGTVFAGWHPITQEQLFIPTTDQGTTSQWKTSTGTDDIATDSTYDGRVNTNQVANSATFPAFKLCKDLTAGGYSDWYLPSQVEAYYLWSVRGTIEAGGNITNFQNVLYWSSTEYSTSNAWRQDFATGYQNDSSKTSGYRVRCVRR